MPRGRSKPVEPEVVDIESAPSKKAIGEVEVSVECTMRRQVIIVSLPGHSGTIRARAHRLDAKGYSMGEWTGGGSVSVPVNQNAEYSVSYQTALNGERSDWIPAGKVTVPKLSNLTVGPRG